jgi:hypothetical protein
MDGKGVGILVGAVETKVVYNHRVPVTTLLSARRVMGGAFASEGGWFAVGLSSRFIFMLIYIFLARDCLR